MMVAVVADWCMSWISAEKRTAAMAVPWRHRCGQVDAGFGGIGVEKHRIVHNHPNTVLDGCRARRRAGVLHPMRSIHAMCRGHWPNAQRASHTSSAFRIEEVARGQIDYISVHENPCHQSTFVPHKLALRSC
jgi:hypothetical protein